MSMRGKHAKDGPFHMGRICRVLAAAALVLSLAVAAGKAAATETDGWSERFQEAMERMNEERYEEAAQILARVIAEHPKEEGKIRPYGMIWIEYFPHRELGICDYHLGRFDDARRELESSILQVDSRRARNYLRKAKKALAEQVPTLAAPVIDGAWPKAITDGTLRLHWSPVPGAGAYEVEIDGALKGVFRFDGAAAEIPIGAAGSVRFRVQAVSPSGQEGPFSAWKEAECIRTLRTADLDAALAGAVALCRKGYVSEAMSTLEGIVRSDPKNGEACFWYGVACLDRYLASGKTDPALKRRGTAYLRRAYILDAALINERATLTPALQALSEESAVFAPDAP